MARKAVTQKDVAEICGVSVALVSYVLSGKAKQGRVSDAMAARIQETAERLNYRANNAARMLKGKSQMTIGCILADIANPFFSVLARKIEDECYRRGYTVIFGSSDEQPDKLERLVEVMLSRQVDGFLISPPEGSSATLRDIQEQEIPLVLIDRRGEADTDIPYVGIDNYSASYQVIRQLIQNGYRRIGMVGHNSQLLHFRERMRGYKAALRESSLPCGDELTGQVEHKNYEERVPEEIDRLIDKEAVDAIYFGSNNMALVGLRHLFRRGCSIPADIEVVSFDDHDIYDFFEPPITHVRQPLESIGQVSVGLLMDEIEGHSTTKETIFKLDALIKHGETTSAAKLRG